ncbi:MAG: lamin tail domain-containing protein [Gammaproteobacteria bacterium]|nr:lamin tail domain-containing protein [Gammaproteobacteria bacterium]
MAKGIARLGILHTLLLITHGASAATVGDLLISEIMVNPAAVSDSRGEWFELYNPSGDEINLRGITIGDDGGDRHRIESDLLILPAHFLTLARNGDAAVNGGFGADYVYDDFTLSNAGDEILLLDGTLELLRLEYGSDFAAAGQSVELVGLPMIAANYGLTPASLNYGRGDIGTPGAPGSARLAPSAVPLPAAAWLFVTAILAIFKVIPAASSGIHAVSSVIPAASGVYPSAPDVIPAAPDVIPAQAGISHPPDSSSAWPDPIRRAGRIQSA